MVPFDATPALDRPREQFIPTPERLSETFGHLKAEEIAVQLRSIEGRKKLADQLIEQTEKLQKEFPDFHPENIRRELDIAGESLLAHERLLKEASSPERKSVLARSWETIKGFPSNHPYITTILLIALLTAGAGYLGYLPSLNFGGWWDGFKGWLGYGTGEGVAEAASEGVSAVGQSGAAEAVTEGGNALSQVAPRYYEVIVNKDGYLFNGVQYAKEQVDQLNVILHQSGVEGSDYIKILRTGDSRFVPWANLMNALEESGLSRDQILSPDSIYEPRIPDSFPFTP